MKLLISKRFAKDTRKIRDERILLRVIDWFLELPNEVRQKLKTEICQIEEQQKMKYVTSFERGAREEGILLGKELG